MRENTYNFELYADFLNNTALLIRCSTTLKLRTYDCPSILILNCKIVLVIAKLHLQNTFLFKCKLITQKCVFVPK